MAAAAAGEEGGGDLGAASLGPAAGGRTRLGRDEERTNWKGEVAGWAVGFFRARASGSTVNFAESPEANWVLLSDPKATFDPTSADPSLGWARKKEQGVGLLWVPLLIQSGFFFSECGMCLSCKHRSANR
jgi:hypothetical protein